ncbi:ribosome-releasing factor 2, mitochondrial-like isoform X2 [Zophobas morio]|uniref:ribosome-releasing factor 2, mitochondrial-like isoform X2 n=1 Tax=Zophobas morio TaxID=2755281 RepID=UPI003082D1EE
MLFVRNQTFPYAIKQILYGFKWYTGRTLLPNKRTGLYILSNRRYYNKELEKIRNVGIMAHIDAGKTTTTERMLFYSGVIKHIGDVDDGDTVMDFMDQERERGITINSAAITLPWKGHTINLIDTPGHVDFTMEVERSLRVLDGAVLILDGVAGVQAQTHTVWSQSRKYNIPTIIFINKLDRVGADLGRASRSVAEKLKSIPLQTQFTLQNRTSLEAIVDVVGMNVAKFEGEHGIDVVRAPLPETHPLYQFALKKRAELIEKLAELDDKFMELIFDVYEGDDSVAKVLPDDIRSALRRVTITRAAVPILCGSSLKDIGVQLLLDAIVAYLPSPLAASFPTATLLDQKTSYSTVEVKPNFHEPLCAFAFKVVNDFQKGLLVYLRIYRGVLHAKSTLTNTSRGKKERVQQLMQAFADEYKDAVRLCAGNIAVVTGLRNTRTGDTLVESSSKQALCLSSVNIPEPVFFCSIEADSLKNEKFLTEVLEILQKEDPSLRVEYDEDHQQTILKGMGELHLEVICEKIRRVYGLSVSLGEMQVAYRESVLRPARVLQQFEGSLGQLCSLDISLSPAEENSDQKNCSDPFFDAVNNVKVEFSIPEENEFYKMDKVEVQTAIYEAVKNTLTTGVLLGFPVSHVVVRILNGTTTNETTVASIAFCVGKALRRLLEMAGSYLLEPIMRIEITCDDKYTGLVLNDLSSQRRGQIASVEVTDGIRFINALVPLSTMIGYSTVLRSQTAGSGTFILTFERYEKLSEHVQKAVLLKIRGYC